MLLPATLLAQVSFDVPQGEKKQQEVFSISLQTAIGLINPKRVNEFIDTDIESRLGGGFIYEIGNSDITVAAAINLALNFKLGEHWRTRIPLEYGGGSKNVSVDGDFVRYSMHRFSTGVQAYYYHEVAEEVALFAGAGPTWHNMSFQKKKASVVGPRAEVGVSWLGRKANREFFLMYESARGITGEGINPYDIDFSGLFFGVRLSF